MHEHSQRFSYDLIILLWKNCEGVRDSVSSGQCCGTDPSFWRNAIMFHWIFCHSFQQSWNKDEYVRKEWGWTCETASSVAILKIGTIMTNCDNYRQSWNFVTNMENSDNTDHIASRGLSLTSCQSCFIGSRSCWACRRRRQRLRSPNRDMPSEWVKRQRRKNKTGGDRGR